MSDSQYRPIPQTPIPDNATTHQEEMHDETVLTVSGPVRWIHFVLGCAILLPWNVMITAMPYFFTRLAGSPLRLAFGSWLACSFTLSNFLWLALATVTAKSSSPSRRVLVTLFSLSVLTALLTFSTFVTVNAGVFFAFVLLNGIAQAGLGAYLQTAVIVIASILGPTAVQALMSGQAAVAVAVSGVQVFSAVASVWGRSKEEIAQTLTSGEPEERSAFIFFTLSTVFLILAAGAQSWLVTMPVYKSITRSLERQKMDESSDEIRGLVSDRPNSDPKSQIIRVAKTNVIFEVAVAYVFIVTLAVYPAITTSIQPTNPNTHPLLFSAVHFLVFNCGDFAGRYICSFPKFLVWSPKRLLTLSLARTLFIPLFLMCNLQRPGSDGPSTAAINSDLFFMLLLLAFGLSNGWISSLCMMAAPSLEHNPRLAGRREDVDVAATVASFCLVAGLMLGSICSFAVRAAVCQCNPFTETQPS
ncbi:Nucleoside transporter [Mycena indigotica]|uniref:Nucleoside transporter n=1 Tax=Mycena indigotica TaxID=2126181 RepID=A0A8H6SM57_9AGAR|nr:Nucleoside transporter [Mycena indigotica]KAF7301568.1 Nucleoside transporter [Mycena indigotica]